MEYIEIVKPEEIEHRSFEILTQELESMHVFLEGDRAPVIKRCIHTTADFSYAQTLCFSEGAVDRLKKLITDGADLVTDTNMALTGINKRELEKYGCRASCFMADSEVARLARERQVTRAAVSMELAMQNQKPVIFVVGNAPTALISLYEAWQDKRYQPAFVVGVPVGFVNVEAAKELILSTDIPCIVNRGRKGGSNVAAAVINAVLYEMRDEKQ